MLAVLRSFIWILCFAFAFSQGYITALSGADEQVIHRLAFGSCNHQDKPQPHWEAILDFGPDLWVWLGDNIYGDSDDPKVLKLKWDKQRGNPGYAKLRDAVRITGTWDDHDYGINDGGKDFAIKRESARLFLDFLDLPQDDPRRLNDGVYGVERYGPPGRRVALFMLDVRTHRDPPRTGGDILGPAQWAWLEEELARDAGDLTILASGTQVFPEEHRFEKWSDYPDSKVRLIEFLRNKTANLLVLSGDRHHSEISEIELAEGHSAVEFTSSSLTHSIQKNSREPNRLRVGPVITANNFGTVTIDWDLARLLVEIRATDGQVLHNIDWPLRLKPSPSTHGTLGDK